MCIAVNFSFGVGSSHFQFSEDAVRAVFFAGHSKILFVTTLYVIHSIHWGIRPTKVGGSAPQTTSAGIRRRTNRNGGGGSELAGPGGAEEASERGGGAK